MDYHNLCLGCMEEKGATKTCPRCGYKEDAAPELPHHLTPGIILQNKYLLGKALGQGGFGITYIAYDTKLEMKLAVKEFFPQGLVYRQSGQNKIIYSESQAAGSFKYGLVRFLDEAKTLARFSEHPNIVNVRDFFEENGTAYMVMNYVEGITLEKYIMQQGGQVNFEKALQVIMPVLDALKEVHSGGILHRDVSPDNIFIDTNGRVKLIDFGAARQELQQQSKSMSVIMKAGYSPPEQYQSRGKQGPWTDVYAVAATMYRALTGHTPLEAIDRMAEDDLVIPSKLGVIIEPKKEKALLKALAVKTGERYQTVEQFQKALVASLVSGQGREGYAGVRQKEKTGSGKVDIKSAEADIGQKADLGPLTDSVKEPAKNPFPDQQPAGRSSGQEIPYMISRKTVKVAVLVVVCGLLIFGAASLFNGGEDGELVPEVIIENETYAPAIIASLDAEYYIDYENGSIPIGDLPIGARVVDPSWEWEFRTGENYSGSGKVKPVTWIVVAKDHYDGLEPHVTLLAEELIGLHAFDNSTDRGTTYGSNLWGESGTSNATRGLRPWLNSSGIHEGEGFYWAFSASFQAAVLTTTVPNKEWKNGSAYSTQDRVFLPSTTELGDTAHSDTYQIGMAYPHFQWAGDAKRMARFGDKTRRYWTRSPDLFLGNRVRDVNRAGEFDSNLAISGINFAVRPALNLKSEIMVSEIRN
jgi:serine/threonine protein kinase